MRIVSVATHKERMYDLFVKSAQKHNIPLDILGMNQVWQGFAWRWTLIQEHLKTLQDDELILITDAFDTLIMKDANAFEKRFKAFNVPIVFSKDPDIHEFTPFARYYRQRVFGEDPIINGGTYIGKCKPLLTFIQHLKYTNDMDDQVFLTQMHRMVRMTVDTKYKLMYHFVGWRTNQKIPDACVITFPASGHSQKVLARLGYEYEDESYSELGTMTLRRLGQYGPFFWREIIWFIVGVCVLSALVWYMY